MRQLKTWDTYACVLLIFCIELSCSSLQRLCVRALVSHTVGYELSPETKQDYVTA
jgi:hypothetical protein